jgi:hypothetical protein
MPKSKSLIVPKSFPLPIPSLTRVHSLDTLDTAAEDLTTFMSQFISVIILTDFSDEPMPDLLVNANKICTDDTAHPLQRVLWIPKEDLQGTLKSTLEAIIKAGFPDKAFTFDNISALSLAPASGKAAYLIYKDPSLSPDPLDKRKKLSTFQIQRAFNNAILQMPKTTEQ